MARPLPALLHLPVQALAVAVLMRRNPETCAAIVLGPQREQPVAAAAAVAVVRGAHRVCSLAASAVATAALLLAGQPPTRLLAAVQVCSCVATWLCGCGTDRIACRLHPELPARPAANRRLSCQPPATASTCAQEQPKPSAALAECNTLFAYLQLVFGFACPLLLLAAQEARIYAAGASAPATQQGPQPNGVSGGGAEAQTLGASELECRTWGRDAVQRRLAQQLARVPSAARGSTLGGMVAAYLLAALWLGLASVFGS